MVEQIQRDALDQSIPVSSLLRRVKLAAAKLGLSQVEAWVQNELNGYASDVPAYRMLKGRPMALNPINGWIPILGEVAEIISKRATGQSIASIEDLLTRDPAGSMHMPFPENINEVVSRSLQGMRFPCALHVDRSQLADIVDQVRTLVLDWAIELERAGITGTEFSFSREERARAQEVGVTNINMHNHGSFVGNLGSGNVAGDIVAREITVQQARDLVRQVRQHEAELAAAGADGPELTRRLEALEAAIADNARPGLLRELFTDLRNTVSGAAGNMVATGVLATLAPYVGAVAR